MLRTRPPLLAVSLLAAATWTAAAEPRASAEEGEAGTDESTAPRIEEVVVVTAERGAQPLDEAIPHATVLSSGELERSPALVLDEALRRVPGFSLFRRTSSLAAHPTTQGVSLRGIGPSGTSRSLVLLDGVPVNDPFGGWVYWNRVPQRALDSVEVVRGATSPLYGSSALGGTLQLLSRAPAEDVFEVAGLGGARSTWSADALAADRGEGEHGWLLAARAFDTDGYFALDEVLRGAVDRPVASAHQSVYGRLERGRFSARTDLYWEQRDNGTRLQTNASRLQMVDLGWRGDRVSGSAYLQLGRFESVFTRIAPGRDSEAVTARQEIDSVGLGGSLLWRAGSGWLAGADWRYASALDEGQNLAGAFLQRRFEVASDLDLLGGLRLDAWQNRSTQATVNPRAGLRWRAARRLTVRASAYRGFRAPTLNELYRPFRVGNVETLANPDLAEEWLWGGELALDLYAARALLVRVNGFWNELGDVVGNATLSSGPEGVLRQRRNLGRARIRGLEADLSLRAGRGWRLSASYLLSDAVLEDGLRVPQVPRHQGTIGVAWDGLVYAAADARLYSEQFEDDLNELALGGFAVVDLMLRRRLAPELELFVAVENLFDERYAVGRTPLEQLGPPRLVHAGIALHLPP